MGRGLGAAVRAARPIRTAFRSISTRHCKAVVGDELPELHYAVSGDVHIAYTVVGDGPIDIVIVAGFLTHLGVLWEEPGYRRFVDRLSSFARVIQFDKRGMGLSDRVQVGERSKSEWTTCAR